MLKKHTEHREVSQNHVMNEEFYVSIAREKESLPPACRNLDKSKEYLNRAKKLIPSQTQTFSKGPTQFVQGVSPGFLARGDGSHVWDVDGNEYIDYIVGLGPVILGHNYQAVSEAAIKQLRNGSAFSLPHFLEVELAEMLVDLIPCAEMVRFGKNGSDATTGSVRVARAFTGREKIASCGYHGWHDWHIGSTTRNLGVPESTRRLTLTFEYNNIESLKKLFEENHNEIAAVIMEPAGVVEPCKDFLSQVKEIAHKNNALLIFDEVVTGFRIALGGAQEYFGVTPDLACFGKAMGNGFPISAVVGKREIMEIFDDVFFSFTFGGEAVSMAAAIATINEMKEKNAIGHIWEQGKKLRDGYNIIAREIGVGHITKCIGFSPRAVMTFHGKNDQEELILRSLLQQEMVKRGVLFLVGNNMCYCHSDGDVEYTLRVYKAALEYIRKAMESGNPHDFLDGPPVKAVFRKA